MTSEPSSDRLSKSSGNRTITVPRVQLINAYIKAFGPATSIASFLSYAMRDPTRPGFSHDDIVLFILMLSPFIVWGWFVLHRSAARIDIDDAHISTVSLLRTRKSIALRDIASDVVILGNEGHKALVLKTAAGAELRIPDLSFSEAELAGLRDDIAARVRRATGRDIPTRPPAGADKWPVAFFVVLLPVVVLAAILLAQAVGKPLRP